LQDHLAWGLGLALRSSVTPLLLAMRWAHAAQSRRLGWHQSEEPPAWNAQLVSKMLLDEVFVAAEFISGSVLALEDEARTIAEVEAAESMFEREGWLDDPHGFHQDVKALRVEDIREVSKPWGRHQHLRYQSDYAPHADEPGRHRWQGQSANRSGHVWLLEHGDEPRPWLVCVPGYRMGHPAVDFAAFRARWLHYELGLNVAVPVMPLHGPRSIGRRGGDGFLSANFLDSIHAQAQATAEVRSLIEWLRQRGAPRVGVHGISLGAYTASLVAALEPDLACVIAGIPASNYLGLLQRHVPAPLLWLAGQRGFEAERIERVMRVVSPLALSPQVPRSRRFLYAGRVDQLAPPTQARELWRHWDRPRIAWYDGGHVSFMWEDAVEELILEALLRGGLVQARRPKLRVVPQAGA
jgi:hypothetical protein